MQNRFLLLDFSTMQDSLNFVSVSGVFIDTDFRESDQTSEGVNGQDIRYTDSCPRTLLFYENGPGRSFLDTGPDIDRPTSGSRDQVRG